MEPTPNVEELRGILEHITENPERWDQSSWAERDGCGTVFCFAGHAVVRAGWIPVWKALGDMGTVVADECEKDGTRAYIPQKAQELLGLTDDQADALFEGANGLEDLTFLIEDIIEGRPVW